jgi:hypothetical protein
MELSDGLTSGKESWTPASIDSFETHIYHLKAVQF